MKSRNSFTNSSLAALAFVFVWTYLWQPFGRAANDAFFYNFPPQIFNVEPMWTVSFFLVLGHAFASPIAWIVLGRVFRSRAGTLVASSIAAYLLQFIFIFLSIGTKGMWMEGPSILSFWGVFFWILVLGANLVAAVLAPLVMSVVARAANTRNA